MDLPEAVRNAKKEKVRNRNSGKIRKAIRYLQEIPVVMSLVVILNFVCDTLRYDIGRYMHPIFGFSAYVLFRLYMMSRMLYVSKWSKVLYLTLILVCLVVFLDGIVDFSLVFVEFQELIFSMFIFGCFSSFLTFLYEKFKRQSKDIRS